MTTEHIVKLTQITMAIGGFTMVMFVIFLIVKWKIKDHEKKTKN